MHKGARTPAGKIRWTCRNYANGRAYLCYQTTDPTSKVVRGRTPEETGYEYPTISRELRPGCDRFIITSAQNLTRVHKGFWRNLLRAAKHFNAEIMVIPLVYRNPTSPLQAKADKKNKVYSWDTAVMPYLWNVRHQLNENLTLVADIRIQPTAMEPLTGLEGFTGTESAIVGHTKLSLKMVPTIPGKMAKVMTTTGACTLRNYSDTRAGKHGDFHHTMGAVLVEVDGKAFHLRQFDANKAGDFTDLGTRFAKGKVKKAPRPAAISLGDTHVDFTDPLVDVATFGPQGMVTRLRPRRIIFHDLLDAYSCNPHHRGNPFNALAKLRGGLNDIEAEVMRAIDYARKKTPRDCEGIIVRSNHDDMLTRAIIANDWKTDPANAEFYLKTALAMVRATKLGTGGTEYPDAFGYWVAQAGLKNVRMLGHNEALIVMGVLLSLHGDDGPNGSRGSLKNLRRIGPKVVIGHSHTPGINEGGMQTGTSSILNPEYVGPVSSWAQAHVITHHDGKRQLVFIINGRYCA